ncbi:hypothetical protein BDP55DRAFT_629089 [Colletotrichum godetiae]|uniref:Uncharacterized protein n=1 Tax=Colletotrichum godetiae TaxID=1209918 RepID=A0AAJ0ASS8_9PEZI|nr:uncharacterized protein BDP55DRAFT_629089 [Colletotrichum godetiae]KAK1689108.1 hypothetical protein BDP55DRAFT_629089 [Colletotrichum godetiae]
MESIYNVSNKYAIDIINSALKTTTMATTTTAVTSPGAPASTMTLNQRISKHRRDWSLDLTNGPVSSPGPKAKYRRSRSWSTRIGVDAPRCPERQTPVLYFIATSKRGNNIPLFPPSPPSSNSSKDVINDEHPLDDDISEEYAICPDTDSPRYKQESDVGLCSGPRSSPGPKARYARSRSWSSRWSDSGYSSGGEEFVVAGKASEGSDSKSYSGPGFFLGFPDDKFVLYDSDYDSEDDDIVMTDPSPLGNSGDGDIITAEYDRDDDVIMADVADVREDDDDIPMPDYIGDIDLIMADYSEDVEIDMTDYSPSELGWSEPEVLSEYTAANWDNGVPELVRYVEFDYSDIEYDGEIPIVVISLAKDEKDYM